MFMDYFKIKNSIFEFPCENSYMEIVISMTKILT
jgi:hypothetical protein